MAKLYRHPVDRSTKSFEDVHVVRRYAFETFIVHLLWLLIVYALTDGFQIGLFKWLEGFYAWDAHWYSSIAQDGHGFMPQTYVFPPGHGWILGALTDFVCWVIGTSLWFKCFLFVAPAFGITCFALFNAGLVYLVEKRFKADRTRLWAIAVANPMGYFALTAYSDTFFALLLLLAVSLALAMGSRHDLWGLPEPKKKWPAVLGLSALLFTMPWVRLSGFSLASWVALKRKEVSATFLSLALFLAYYWVKTDRPFFFLTAQTAFDMPEGSGMTGLFTAFGVFWQGLSGDGFRGGDFLLYWVDFGILPVVTLTAMLALSVWLVSRREFVWALTVISIVMMSHNQAFWRSTVRYMLPFFPMLHWMILAPKAESTAHGRRVRELSSSLLLALGLAMQIMYCRIFRSGGWAF